MKRIAESQPTRLGHLVTPRNWGSLDAILATGLPWAIDNGAFSGFNAHAFMQLCLRAESKPRLLWVACPDVVGDSVETLRLFQNWHNALRRLNLPIAFVGQDGAEKYPLPWADFECFFIGGSTDWKLSGAAMQLAHEAKDRGKLVHMGRVNSLRRMRRAKLFGCDTIDGSSASMFGDKKIEKYLLWLKWLDEQGILHMERS